MVSRDLKSMKLVFRGLDGNRCLNVNDINSLIENSLDKNLINFFRGCKHILERHYTEAIKWFQLADNFNESILLILFSSIKLKDGFLYNEYKTDLTSLTDFKIFNKYGFFPFIKIEDREERLDIDTLKNLEKKYLTGD